MTSLHTAPAEAVEPTTARSSGVLGLLRGSFARFLVAGGLSTGIDMSLLYLLHGVLHVQLSVATFTSVLVSFAVNFFLNRVWSFGSASPVGGQMVRYLILAALNWAATVFLVSGLAALGLNYLLAKALTVLINSVVNYFAYRHWVFKKA